MIDMTKNINVFRTGDKIIWKKNVIDLHVNDIPNFTIGKEYIISDAHSSGVCWIKDDLGEDRILISQSTYDITIRHYDYCFECKRLERKAKLNRLKNGDI